MLSLMCKCLEAYPKANLLDGIFMWRLYMAHNSPPLMLNQILPQHMPISTISSRTFMYTPLCA